MIRIASAFLSAAFAWSIAAPASADASSDLYQAMDRTIAAHTYHMVMTSPRMSFAGDYAFPTTMHMVMANGMEIVNVNAKMYMKMPGQAWQNVPAVGGMSDSVGLSLLKLHHSDYRASDLGMKVVGGQSLHAYHVTALKTGTPETAYVDGAGRVVRVELPTITIQLSKFGEPVHIVAPI